MKLTPFLFALALAGCATPGTRSIDTAPVQVGITAAGSNIAQARSAAERIDAKATVVLKYLP